MLLQSTYLRQVALTAILAHMGSYVPAAFATVPLLDGVFTRMGTADSIERNSSSFMLEMQVVAGACRCDAAGRISLSCAPQGWQTEASVQEAAHIINSATGQSLVLIDELGCATSTQASRARSAAVRCGACGS